MRLALSPVFGHWWARDQLLAVRREVTVHPCSCVDHIVALLGDIPKPFQPMFRRGRNYSQGIIRGDSERPREELRQDQPVPALRRPLPSHPWGTLPRRGRAACRDSPTTSEIRPDHGTRPVPRPPSTHHAFKGPFPFSVLMLRGAGVYFRGEIVHYIEPEFSRAGMGHVRDEARGLRGAGEAGLSSRLMLWAGRAILGFGRAEYVPPWFPPFLYGAYK